MFDFFLLVVVLATVDGHQEPRASTKRGFTQAECAAAASIHKPGERTPPGDLIVITACVRALAPTEQKQDPQPDARNKGAI